MNLKDNGEPDTGLNFTRRMPLFGQLFDADACDLEVEAQGIRNKRVFQLLLLNDEYPIERRNEEGGSIQANWMAHAIGFSESLPNHS